MDKYKKAVIHVLELAAASLVIAALLQAFASFTYDMVDFKTGFDHAVKLLYKYPKDVASIFAYCSAIFAVFALSVCWYGSELEAFIRKKILVPAFEIASHMLAMAAGVFVVWFFSELASAEDGSEFISSTYFSALSAMLLMFALAVISECLAIYLASDFDTHMQRIAKFRVVFLLVVTAILYYVVSHDVVWKYQPITAIAGTAPN